MKLEGDYTFDAGVQDVWDALFDPAVLAAVMPGCEKLELRDGSYYGELKVKVGPIQGNFSGKVDLLDLNEPKSYRMVIDGRGSQGFVKATATIALDAEGDRTKIRYDSDAQVGGKIASVGQRLVETSARAIVKQSLEGLNENIQIRAKAHREARAAATADGIPADAASAGPAPATSEVPVTEPVEKAEIEVGRGGVQAAAAPAPIAPAPNAPAPIAPAPTAVAPIAPAPIAPAPTAPAPKPAAPAAPTPAASTPVAAIQYKRADAGKLARSIAKEVTKTVAPIVIGAAVIVALVIYMLVR